MDRGLNERHFAVIPASGMSWPESEGLVLRENKGGPKKSSLSAAYVFGACGFMKATPFGVRRYF